MRTEFLQRLADEWSAKGLVVEFLDGPGALVGMTLFFMTILEIGDWLGIHPFWILESFFAAYLIFIVVQTRMESPNTPPGRGDGHSA